MTGKKAEACRASFLDSHAELRRERYRAAERNSQNREASYTASDAEIAQAI